MTKTRFNAKQLEKICPELWFKQKGYYCVMCGKTPDILTVELKNPTLIVEHVDNFGNDDISNLRFTCKNCNTKKDHPQNLESYERSATPELILGKKNEKNFRYWICGQFEENANLGLSFDYLINSEAEKIEYSQESTKRYLDKMISDEGMYEWFNKYVDSMLALKEKYRQSNGDFLYVRTR